MDKKTQDIESFLNELPTDRKDSIQKIRTILNEHLPEGFEETFSSNMIHYVVPFSVYPKGYHATPETPLPFISLASQKNHVAFYHMGIYMFPEVLDWFEEAYKKQVPTKLDMGKSCVRFKNTKNIPYELIAELSEKITAKEYIEKYEESIAK